VSLKEFVCYWGLLGPLQQLENLSEIVLLPVKLLGKAIIPPLTQISIVVASLKIGNVLK
jgi:hypothetical protein